jgi:hypothetical protein
VILYQLLELREVFLMQSFQIASFDTTPPLNE